MSCETRPPVVIAGAGLVGSLLAIYLVRRGHAVRVLERGAHPGSARASAGRSINLVITHRGLHALERVGLRDAAMGLTVPVLGRMMHAIDGQLSYQPYGRDESECNYSISRGDLNRFLDEEALRRGAVIDFETSVRSIDLSAGRIEVEGGESLRPSVLFGADGAGSVVRAAVIRGDDAQERVEMLDHGYKELEIPAEQGRSLERHALHIWPRGSVMLMALPNLDGSFTVTLYLPYRGPLSFARLQAPEDVRAFFEQQFPDAVHLMPALEEQFFANPTGELGTVRCRPWTRDGRVLLVGDAAHAIVPFFGQGMNCGFEDCEVLDRLLDDHGDDFERVFAEFETARKPNADAIADMALDNFIEMRDRVGDARFLLAKQVEHRLEQEMPLEYRSRYSMVMYSRIPYAVAREVGDVQVGLLEDLCRGIDKAESLDLERARSLIRERLTPLLHDRAVSLDY